LKIADVVIGSLATAKPILRTEEMETLLRDRKYRPMFLIDLGVPRNFDERLNSLDNVYLYDIDDLGSVVVDSVEDRTREAAKAEVIVELELESFWRWMQGLEILPAIKEIRSNVERVREKELLRHRHWLTSLGPDERANIEALTRGIVNKILHQVLTELRRGAGVVEGVYAAEIARRLLGELAPDGPSFPDADQSEDEDD
jgi:glutamyl-tRNA reductase